MPIRDVEDAMREMKAGSKHIKTRAQAIAVGLKAEGKSNLPSKPRGAAAGHAWLQRHGGGR